MGAEAHFRATSVTNHLLATTSAGDDAVILQIRVPVPS